MQCQIGGRCDVRWVADAMSDVECMRYRERVRWVSDAMLDGCQTNGCNICQCMLSNIVEQHSCMQHSTTASRMCIWRCMAA